MFKKTSNKITLGILVITTFILLFVSFFAIHRANSELQDIIGSPDVKALIAVPQGPRVFFQAQKNPFVELEKRFNEKLTMAIVGGGLLGILLALFAGSFFSKVITKPLSHIQDGMRALKDNNKKVLLGKTGEEEFDIVIDEFNDLVKELNYQEELRSNLIADVAHELKTPLTALIGQVQGVKDKVFTLDDERIEILTNEMNRLSNLVDSLNEYTHIRSRLPNLDLQPTKVRDVIENIKHRYEKELNDKGVEIEENVDSNFILDTDQKLFDRLLSNIIENAIFYSGGNKITVTADKDLIVIKDNGKGIEEEHLNKIFERFYRIEKSRNRKTGGLGLGLAIVKEIVEAHGWTIKAQENESGGAQFTIYLSKAD